MAFSFLDRLTDPDISQLQPTSLQYTRKLKAVIRRDLEMLLNTRRAESDFDPCFEHATSSLLTFGVVDFTALNLTNSVDQERVRCSVERAIRQFEPRLSHVKVLLEEPTPSAPLLRLSIEASLQVGAQREDVTFPVSLYRDSRRVAVSGDGR